MAHPRVYTIPPDAPFLDTLARAVLAGELPAGGGEAPRGPELSRWTILLPTRRAARALGDAFLRAGGGEAMVLPQIRPIGDVDEDALSLEAPPEPGAGGLALDLPPAISNLDRRIALTKLISGWSRSLASSAQDEGFRVPATSAQASALAAELAAFMDSLDMEQVSLDGLEELAPDRFAEHWQQTLEFLKIVTQHWPAYLAEHNVMAPYVRRDELMKAETARLLSSPPDAPVIAAGSTATVPATAALLEAVARLENGAVVLPGLDTELDDESWRGIREGEGHPEHPQFGMQQFLARLGIGREEVAVFGGEPGSARAKLLSEVMRPAGETQKWQQLSEQAARDAVLPGLDGLKRIDAPTEQDEAEAVSLLLRHAVETPGKAAALVTPDRTLARRVAARLEKWGLRVDDSAGRPLEKTLPGGFLDALAEAVNSRFAPVPLLTLLKHPLTLMGREPAEMRRAARLLELTAFRQAAVGKGFDAYGRALERSKARTGPDGHAHSSLRRLKANDWKTVQDLLEELERIFADLAALMSARGREVTLRMLVEAHLAAAGALTAAADGSASALWRGEAGDKLHGFATSLLDAQESIEIVPQEYLELQRSLMAGLAVHPRSATHPRIHIWGPLEARLQRPDMVILAGLNEGTWPASVESDPWLSRPMREEIGLPSPERRVGLAAHDVAQLMGAGEVWLTRAEKAGGSPTVPSRWLLRLDAVLGALSAGQATKADDCWLAWARARDEAPESAPLPAPAPCPPVEARPTQLSVTRIQDWIANPYSVYARAILRLSKLEDLAGEPDAALRGSVLHDALMRFTRKHPETLPKDIAAALMQEVNALLNELGDNARVKTFWQGQFARFALWFAATEPGRRAGAARAVAEVKGKMDLGGFTLSGVADRIDMLQDGTLSIYDYKTGTPPAFSDVDDGRAPQLPLEAAMALQGGFDDIPAAHASRLAYIRAHGYGAGGEERDAGKAAPDVLAAEALDKLGELVRDYSDPAQPYRALRRQKFDYRYDDYAHLARVQEWQAEGEGEG